MPFWVRRRRRKGIDFEARESDAVIVYAAYFELLNGFLKTVYWTKEQVEKHRKKFSKSDFGWKKDWDAMATKTVLKALLSKWGILSVEMQKAVVEDEEEREVKDITPEAEVDVIDYVPEEQQEGPINEPEDKKEPLQQDFGFEG